VLLRFHVVALQQGDCVIEAELQTVGLGVLHDLKEQLRHFHLKSVTVAAYDSPQSIGRYLFGGEPHSALVLCGERSALQMEQKSGYLRLQFLQEVGIVRLQR